MIAEGFYFPYRTKNNLQYISINQINDVKNNILLQPGLKWEANAMVSSDGETRLLGRTCGGKLKLNTTEIFLCVCVCVGGY